MSTDNMTQGRQASGSATDLLGQIRRVPWYVWAVLAFAAVWLSSRLSDTTEFPQEVLGIQTDIPAADWVDRLVSWLLQTFNVVFDEISAFILQRLMLPIENFLVAIPWPVVLIVIGALAWISTRSKLTTTVLVLLMVMVGTFDLWNLTMTTLALVIASVTIALVIGLPLGILSAQSQKVNTVLRPLLDGMQTMPSFIYLIPAMMFFGLGMVPAVMATVVYAVPPLIRLTALGIHGVPPSTIEAAQAYGATRGQLLKDVQLPLAMPAIMAGVNQTMMMALAMVVIASMIGARGLGAEVLLAINRIEVGRGFEAGMCIVALAIIIDRITQGFAKRYEESIS